MNGVGRVRTRATLLGVALALWLASPAGAVSQAYGVAPGSQFTPAGGAAETLTGAFELSLAIGGCQPAPPGFCSFWYRFAGLELASDGLDLTLTPKAAIPGLLELSLGDLQFDQSLVPEIYGLVVERSTLPPLFAGEARYRDLVLRTSAAGLPGNEVVFDPAGSPYFPTSIALDLELVDVRRLVIFDPYGDHVSTLSTTTLGSLALTATPVPEPNTAALLGGGLALLAGAARRSARRAG